MNTLIGIGKYLQEDYEEILRISSDRNNLDKTWQDWRKNQKNVKTQLQKSGLKIIDIIVKPHELVSYCRERGLDINGESRAEFVSHKTQLINEN